MSKGTTRAEGALGARPAHARQDRRVGDHRAGLGLGRVRRHEGDRAARRRGRLRAERQQDLHHERPVRRHHRVHLQARRAGRRPEGPQESSHFVLDKGMPGLTQSKPMRKMGLHSSPTGELFLAGRRGRRRPPARRERGRAAKAGESGAKDTFPTERTGVAAMALGMIERCLELSVEYAQDARAVRPADRRVPAHPAEAREDGGRADERRRTWCSARSSSLASGKSMSFAEASAMKLYSAQRRDGGRARRGAALRRQRLHGRVPASSSSAATRRCCRSTRGTDEMQVSRDRARPALAVAARPLRSRRRRRRPRSRRRSSPAGRDSRRTGSCPTARESRPRRGRTRPGCGTPCRRRC